MGWHGVWGSPGRNLYPKTTTLTPRHLLIGKNLVVKTIERRSINIVGIGTHTPRVRRVLDEGGGASADFLWKPHRTTSKATTGELDIYMST
jgi:hypothetical protein